MATDFIISGPFDNDISILYKAGAALDTPIRYILVRSETPKDSSLVNRHKGRVYERLTDVIANILGSTPGSSPYFTAYTYINNYLPLLPVDEIAFLISFIESERDTDNDVIVDNLNELYRDIQQLRNPVEDRSLLTTRFPATETFRDEYVRWLEKYDRLILGDQVERGHLELGPQMLEAIDEKILAPISDLQVNGITVRFSPRLIREVGREGDKSREVGREGGRPVTAADGIDIFNEANISSDVPYLQYNSEISAVTEDIRQKVFRIYHGSSAQDIPRLDYIMPALERTHRDNAFYLTVATTKTRTQRLTKKSYQYNHYYLNDNQLFVTSPVTETQREDLMIGRVAKVFPSLDLGPPTEVSVSGVFYIYGVAINDFAFNDRIMLDPLMSQYLYIDESNTSHANKIQHKIRFKSLMELYEGGEEHTSGHLKNFSSVDINLKQHVVKDAPETVTVAGKQYELRISAPYLEVRITKSESREVALKFIEIFRRLLSYYLDEEGTLVNYYHLVLPKLIPPSPPAEPEKPAVPKLGPALTSTAIGAPVPGQVPACKKGPGAPARTTKVTRIDRLETLAPDLFVKGYARKCQCKFQPDILQTPEEVEIWRQQTFEYPEGVEHDRQVLEFPHDAIKYYLVCPSNDYPFPGIKDNDLKNKDIYPYIPCCNKKDHMRPGSGTLYDQIYLGQEKKVTTGGKTTKIKRDQFLDTHRIGFIPATKVTELLMNYSPDASDMARYGVPRTVNSLIHCVLVALDDPEYMSLETDDAREYYAQQIRRAIATDLAMNTFKQELYDFDEEAIRDQLLDADLFLDPFTYYRGLEELYNINIYTFIPAATKEDPTNGKLEVPRHKAFHGRPLRNYRQTIVIYKHRGSTSDELLHPHCELLVDEVKKGYRKIFQQDMNQLLHRALLNSTEVVTFGLERSATAVEMVARSNLYSRVDFYDLIKREASGQIVDAYGKTRTFIIMSAQGPLAMTVPSSQPENLPSYRGPLPSVPVETATSIFGEPTAVNTEEGLTTGVWFPVMDLPYGVHVVIDPTEKYRNLPLGPTNPVIAVGVSPVLRMRKLQRTLDVLLQIIEWLFVIAQVTRPLNSDDTRTPVLVDQFVTDYFQVKSPPSDDSAEHYDLSEMPRLLPIVSSVEEALVVIAPFVPSLIQENRLTFYSERLQDKVIEKLREYYVLASPLPVVPLVPGETGSDWMIPTDIRGLFVSSLDFIQQPSVAIFVGEDDLIKWLGTVQKPGYMNLIIRNRLDIAYGLQEEPYLYAAPDGKIYLVQNVYGGVLEKAVRVAYEWRERLINPGPASESYLGEDVDYVIYSISRNGSPVVSTDNSNDSTNYLQILLYGEGLKMIRREKIEFVKLDDPTGRKYAAMLPLL